MLQKHKFDTQLPGDSNDENKQFNVNQYEQ